MNCAAIHATAHRCRISLAHVAVVAAAGGAHALSLAWPWTGQPLWWLQLLALMVLAHMLHRTPSARHAFVLGWSFATAALVGTFWWLFIAMHTYGGLAAPLSALAVLALAAFLGSYYAGATGCFWLMRRYGRVPDALLFAALWLLAELARGTLWTGFPWGASGYAHTDGPLAALARWVGVYGLSAVAAALAWMLAQLRWTHLRQGRTWGTWGVVGMVFVAATWQRQHVLEQPPPRAPVGIALLQGNITQDEKFQPGSGIAVALHWYARELRAAQADIVVAPETAIALLPQQLPAGYLEALQARFERPDHRQAALVGIALGDEAQGYTNTVLGWSPAQTQPYRYDKHHLVPFGEFIPPLFKWFTQMMNIPLGDFNRGALGQPSMLWAGERIAPHICYEDLFGEELATRFSDPATAPSILVNVSNIAWFGHSVAILQHLQISRMRALEFERPLARATNTGATALIDHRGRVVQQLPAHERAVLQGHIQGFDTLTPYARWAARWGLWPLWIAALGVLCWVIQAQPWIMKPLAGDSAPPETAHPHPRAQCDDLKISKFDDG